MPDKKQESHKAMQTSGFNPLDVDEALRWVDDTFKRMLCPYVLLGQTARDIVDAPPTVDGGHLTSNEVEVGVEKKNLTKEVLSTLKVLIPDIELGKDGNYRFEYSGVPVLIRVIEKKYKYLKTTDIKFYLADEYRIPNPFEDYWKARGLIK